MNYLKSKWFTIPWWSIRKSSYLAWLMVLGAILLLVLAGTLYIRSLPSLDIWHTVQLKEEFTVNNKVKDFKSYLALEKRLFAELDRKIIQILPKEKQSHINRYSKGSLSDPKRWSQNWNRSFEMPVKDAKMGVLLIHGMSDSPYSLHTQAAYLHKHGIYVLGVRLPGHGTIPSGLLNTTWQDMAAVVKMGMIHLKEKVGTHPIQIIGYSTGAPLALHYTFEALKTSSLPVPEKLVFISPAIGINPAAKFAVLQQWVATFLHLDKLQWNSVTPEYDPFKYGSFSINAAYQVYALTKVIEQEFEKFKNKKKHSLPPILTFASIVDATVSVSDIVSGLYAHLNNKNSTLLLFDINNKFSQDLLIREQELNEIKKLRNTHAGFAYTFELISDINTSGNSLTVIRNHHTKEVLNLSWPSGVYSLSHIALPFRADDPLYGNKEAAKSPGIQLGHLAGYGERNLLQISSSARLRLRWNPFQTYTQKRILAFFALSPEKDQSSFVSTK